MTVSYEITKCKVKTDIDRTENYKILQTTDRRHPQASILRRLPERETRCQNRNSTSVVTSFFFFNLMPQIFFDHLNS